jgi:hypothetical protein
MSVAAASFGAIALALVSVTAEAIWRPAAEYAIDGLKIAWFGERWTGIDNQPVSDRPSQKKEIASCPLRSEVADVSELPHHNTEQSWRITSSHKGTVSARFEEDSRTYDAIGMMQDRWVVISYRNPTGAHGTIYLEMIQNRYYGGYLIGDDCHSPRRGAGLKCPYVLFRPNDGDIARRDPILSEKCQEVMTLHLTR